MSVGQVLARRSIAGRDDAQDKELPDHDGVDAAQLCALVVSCSGKTVTSSGTGLVLPAPLGIIGRGGRSAGLTPLKALTIIGPLRIFGSPEGCGVTTQTTSDQQ